MHGKRLESHELDEIATGTRSRLPHICRRNTARLRLSLEPFVSHMKRSHIGQFRYLSALLASGAATVALATWACFRLGLGSATTACVYLVIIVLLSLMDSFVSSVIFSVIVVGCLDYFFIQPLFAFEVSNAQDLTTLSAFLITSIVITSLVRRLRRLGHAHRDQARLLDLTRDSVLVRDLEVGANRLRAVDE